MIMNLGAPPMCVVQKAGDFSLPTVVMCVQDED